MKKFIKILLISDYDGTFTSQIPENYKKNIAAVERFKKDGGLFAFATGRDFHSIAAVEPNFAKIANAPIIMANGARLYDPDKKEFIVSHTLNLPLFLEYLDVICENYPGIGVRFSCENGLVTPALNEILKDDLKDIFAWNISVRKMSAKELLQSGEKVYKCVMVCDPKIIDNVKKLALDFSEKINSDEIFFTKTYIRGLEAVDKNATKAATALKLKEYLNARDNCEYKLFAIGDYDNDLDMIKLADCGAAPENALDEVKKSAKVVTVGNNDGAVADFIGIIERDYVYGL